MCWTLWRHAPIALCEFMSLTGLFGLSSAVTSGFIYSIISLPLDTAKTRMQNQTALANGSFKYTGTVQTLGSILKSEGPMALMKVQTHAKECGLVYLYLYFIIWVFARPGCCHVEFVTNCLFVGCLCTGVSVLFLARWRAHRRHVHVRGAVQADD